VICLAGLCISECRNTNKSCRGWLRSSVQSFIRCFAATNDGFWGDCSCFSTGKVADSRAFKCSVTRANIKYTYRKRAAASLRPAAIILQLALNKYFITHCARDLPGTPPCNKKDIQITCYVFIYSRQQKRKHTFCFNSIRLHAQIPYLGRVQLCKRWWLEAASSEISSLEATYRNRTLHVRRCTDTLFASTEGIIKILLCRRGAWFRMRCFFILHTLSFSLSTSDNGPSLAALEVPFAQ
jgi:hypothetical protein